MSDSPTAAYLNHITGSTVDAAVKIHRRFGSGLLEQAYLGCLCYELRVAGFRFEVQRPVPLIYEGVTLGTAYRADLVIENAVIIEVKALETLPRVYLRQLRTYLELADCRVGLLLNFGAKVMKDGIERVVNDFPEE